MRNTYVIKTVPAYGAGTLATPGDEGGSASDNDKDGGCK